MTAKPIVLFSGDPEKAEAYRKTLPLEAAAAGLEVDFVFDLASVAPGDVDFIVFDATGEVKDFTPFTKCRAVLNLWAGVEALMKCPAPEGLTLCRMVESGLTEGMRDYVLGHVFRHHINVDRYIGSEAITDWEVDFPPLARNRTVGVLGLGELGADCAGHIAQHGFRTLGWSRSQKEVPGVTCLAGPGGLDETLRQSEILVLLLPHTDETFRVVNADRLALMPAGAYIVNAGRGALIDHDALLDALDAGHIAHATMDVFDVEPLPPEHRYWTHPRVTVTPHIASVTRPETASVAIIANIQRNLAGEAMIGVVRRNLGY